MLKNRLVGEWKKHFEKAWPYLMWFLFPLAIIYGIDLLTFVLWVVQIVATITIFLFIVMFLGGAALGILKFVPSHRDPGIIRNVKLYKVLPPMQWGYHFIQWALSEEEE